MQLRKKKRGFLGSGYRRGFERMILLKADLRWGLDRSRTHWGRATRLR